MPRSRWAPALAGSAAPQFWGVPGRLGRGRWGAGAAVGGRQRIPPVPQRGRPVPQPELHVADLVEADAEVALGLGAVWVGGGQLLGDRQTIPVGLERRPRLSQ